MPLVYVVQSQSFCQARVAHSGNFRVFLCNIVVNLNMSETFYVHGWANIVFLTHFEVFTEVLITAPPIRVDHTKSLVSADLMEVRVSHVILFTISGETTVLNCSRMVFICLSNVPSPRCAHSFFLSFCHNVK